MADNQNLLKETKESISKLGGLQKPNPRFTGKRHSQDSKDAISQTQLSRNQMIRQLVKKGMNTLSEERVKAIIREELVKYVKNNTTKNMEYETKDERIDTRNERT